MQRIRLIAVAAVMALLLVPALAGADAESTEVNLLRRRLKELESRDRIDEARMQHLEASVTYLRARTAYSAYKADTSATWIKAFRFSEDPVAERISMAIMRKVSQWRDPAYQENRTRAFEALLKAESDLATATAALSKAKRRRSAR